MRYLIGHIIPRGKITWESRNSFPSQGKPEGLTVVFPFHSKISQFDASVFIQEQIVKEKICWLSKENGKWKLNSELFKDQFKDFTGMDWLRGNPFFEFEFEYAKEEVFGRQREIAYFRLIVTSGMVEEQMPKRIFLSHKGVDKPFVRQFKIALEGIGLSPWLDEDAMHAGVELERGILGGFKDSCAAVFFITKDFKDEKYLSTEINYAISEKRDKGDRFSVITLAFKEAGYNIQIPSLLRTYVWKEPDSDIEALCQIVRALPIKVGDLGWK